MILKGKVPFKWMAPEALSFEKVSKESDSWSYGVLLWEIFNYGSTPYPTIEKEDLLEKLKLGYRMERPECCPEEVYDKIMMKCWEWDAKKRPSFDEIVKLFKELIENSGSECLTKMLEKQEKYECLNDDKYYLIWPRNRESDCSVCHKDDRLHPGNIWHSSSQSSFNPSTLTNTISSSTSHSDVNKPMQNFFNLKKIEIEVEEKPLLRKHLFSKGEKKLPEKKTRKNPIYGEIIVKGAEDKSLMDQECKHSLSDEEKITKKNWKNFFGVLSKSRPQMTHV